MAGMNSGIESPTTNQNFASPAPGDRDSDTGRSARFSRSRITNGSDLLPTIDGRSAWARMFRDTCEALTAHVGGADRVSEPERMTIRRAAALECELVRLEIAFAEARAAGRAPEAADVDLYSRITNTQRRVLETLGMEKKPRDVTPDLSQYLDASAK
jgi:hypothetical protein